MCVRRYKLGVLGRQPSRRRTGILIPTCEFDPRRLEFRGEEICPHKMRFFVEYQPSQVTNVGAEPAFHELDVVRTGPGDRRRCGVKWVCIPITAPKDVVQPSNGMKPLERR